MKNSILFVDDEKQILNSLRRVFMDKDYKMHFALSGQEALTILENNNIDLIVSDMRMPGMDGRELLKIVKKKYPHMLRMILSGYSDEKQMLDVIENNLCLSYSLKPWKNEELVKIISNMFNYEHIILDKNLIQTLNDIEKLPYSLDVYNKLCTAIDENSNVDIISSIIEEDPSITLKVLSIVNSAFYGLKTGSIKQAINYLGLNNVKNLVLVSCMISLENSKFSKELNILWNHLLSTNDLLIKVYKYLLKENISDEFIAIGLLHDIGKGVIVIYYDSDYNNDGKEYNRVKLTIEQEKNFFKNSHSEIGSYLLSRFGFPEEIVEAIMFHHEPLNPRVKNKKLLSALHIAEYYSWRSMTQESIIELDENVLKYLNLTEEQCEDILMNAQN